MVNAVAVWSAGVTGMHGGTTACSVQAQHQRHVPGEGHQSGGPYAGPSRDAPFCLSLEAGLVQVWPRVHGAVGRGEPPPAAPVKAAAVGRHVAGGVHDGPQRRLESLPPAVAGMRGSNG